MSPKITETPIPLIFKQILKEKKNGELTISGPNYERYLFFMDGHLKFGKTTVIQERLGEILFKLGKINQTQFWNIHKLIEGKGDKIGKLLVQKEILTQKDVFFGLLYQIRTIAITSFLATEGTWEFKETIPEIPVDLNFTIELPGIISEGINKIHNFTYYRERFGQKAPKIVPLPPGSNDFPAKDFEAFGDQIKEYPNTTCEKLVPLLNIPEEIFWKRSILFYLVNALSFVDISGDKNTEKNVDELTDLHEKLKERRIDFYELFGLENSATAAEIKETYFAYAKRFHPDRIDDSFDPELKEKANFVFATINRAYETLSDEQKRNEYDSSGFKEGEDEASTEENQKERARVLYLKAKTLYNKKQYWEATSLLTEAIRLDNSKPAYMLLAGMAQTYVPDQRREAEKSLQKAIDLEPWNAEPLVAMGLLFFTENLNKRAESFFRKAVSINPEHLLAIKKLEEMGFKVGKKSKSGGFFKKKRK